MMEAGRKLISFGALSSTDPHSEWASRVSESSNLVRTSKTN